MTLAIQSSKQIKKTVKDPMKNEEHFHLLPEVDLFVTYELCLILGFPPDPDKNEK